MWIANAYAQAAPGGGESIVSGLLPLILMFGLLWFLMIRPQMKKAKEHKAMIQALQKGDEVITQGGVAGQISEICDDHYARVKIAENTEIIVQRAAIQVLLPKGTIKAL